MENKKGKKSKISVNGFNYSNRLMRRKYRVKNEKELTHEDALAGKTRLQKWMEVTQANIEMGKSLDSYYLNQLISISDEENSNRNARCLSSLEEFYGDKAKALLVHQNNLRIQSMKTFK
jgi:hypothetical protein